MTRGARGSVDERLPLRQLALEAQAEASPDGTIVVSREGEVIVFNRRFAEMWGIPGEMVGSRSVLQSVADKLADPDELLRRVAELDAHPGEESREELRLRDGRTFERSSAPVKAPDGALYGRVWLFRDVTELKRVEAARDELLRSERTARAEAERTAAALRKLEAVTRGALAHVSLRDLFDEMLERVAESLGADTSAILLLDENGELEVRAAHGLEEDLARAAPVPLEAALARRVAASGEPVVVGDLSTAEFASPHLRERGIRSLVAIPLVVEGRVIGVARVGSLEAGRFGEEDARLLQLVADQIAVALDEAGPHEAEREAPAQAETAFGELTGDRALEELRTEFVSIVSHELRTPLAAIYGAAMTLRRSDVELDEEQRSGLLAVIADESDRLARIVNEILWASRLDSGTLQVSLQSCDGAELARSVAGAARTHLPTGVELRLTVPAELPPVFGDPDKVRQVLVNLLDNAIKYSPVGGLVELALERRDPRLRFSVRDQGLGVPPAEQGRIFEKFYRLDPTLTGGIGGTGLGLYICRELVQRMDGRIWVESREDGGSTFSFELPLAEGRLSQGYGRNG